MVGKKNSAVADVKCMNAAEARAPCSVLREVMASHMQENICGGHYKSYARR